jgi:hypothetical protein
MLMTALGQPPTLRAPTPAAAASARVAGSLLGRRRGGIWEVAARVSGSARRGGARAGGGVRRGV